MLLEKDAGHYQMFLHVSSRFCNEPEFVHVSVLRDNVEEKYGSQESERREGKGKEETNVFSTKQRKMILPLSLAIDADKNSFFIIWYLLDKNERRVISRLRTLQE